MLNAVEGNNRADCGKCRKQINGKSAEFLNFIAGGTYHDHWAFNV
jgi:hypothetical protein